MNLADLKLNTYVPAVRAQFAVPISVERREFLTRSAFSVLRIVGNTDLLAESAMLVRDVAISPSDTQEFLPCDDLTPIENAARRLMMIVSIAKVGSYDVFTEEEVIALAFDAGCDVTVVEDADGATFLPIKEIRVARRPDGLIVVFEEGASEGVFLER